MAGVRERKPVMPTHHIESIKVVTWLEPSWHRHGTVLGTAYHPAMHSISIGIMLGPCFGCMFVLKHHDLLFLIRHQIAIINIRS